MWPKPFSKIKKPIRKRAKCPSCTKETAGPLPTGPGNTPPCGHSKCGDSCNVRYVGPVSQIHDHHAFHAARGSSHVWAASIITGFAIVLTGILAYSTVQAQAERDQALAQRQTASRLDVIRLLDKLDKMDAQLKEIKTITAATQTNSPAPGERY